MNTASFLSAVPVWPAGRSTVMNDFVLFRTIFNGETGKNYTLRLTGSTLYRVRLNGEFLAYGPARGPKGYFRIDEIPFNASVGENVLEIEVSGCNVNSYYYMDQSSFLQAEVCLGDTVIACTGKDFTAYDLSAERVRKVSRYCYQRMFAEVYRVKPARIGLAELKLETFPARRYLSRTVPFPEYKMDSSYKPVRTFRRGRDLQVETQNRYYDDRPSFKCYRHGDLEFDAYTDLKQLTYDENGPIVSTLYGGRINNTGFIRLKVNCKTPGRLTVMFSEIAPGNCVEPTRQSAVNAIFWNLLEPGLYELEAIEANTLKYAEVFMEGGEADVLDFSLREYKSPLGWDYSFPCDDPDLKAVFDAGRETFAANAVDCFTDCPSRERAAWLCDSYFTAQTSLMLTGSTLLERFFLENFALADEFEYIAKGAIPMLYPGDHTDQNFIPNWAMWLIIQTNEYLKRSGDRELITLIKPKFDAFIQYMETFQNSDGLLENLTKWVFVEWSKANEFVQDVSYPTNMIYAVALESMAEMYGEQHFADRAAAIKETIRKQSFDGMWFRDHGVRQEDRSLLVPESDITETCQYYAFFTRCATPESHPDLWKRLCTEFGPDRKEKGLWQEIYPSNAFIGNYLRLELLSQAGFHEQVLRETTGYFKKMADLTGTLWEHDNTHASCCHGFASYINVLMVRALDARAAEK